MELTSLRNGVLIDTGISGVQEIINIVKSTNDLPYVAGYKVNSRPAIESGLRSIIYEIRKQAAKPVIYDHQKFGCDLPEVCGSGILDFIKSSGADGIIILPLSGKGTLETVIKKCMIINLLPIVAGDLYYSGYFTEEGGYMDYETQQKIYLDSARLGVSHFIMSCNRVNRIRIYCHQLAGIVGQLKVFFTAVESTECSNIPESCEQLKDSRVFAIFENKFSDTESYRDTLENFWQNFCIKLRLS